MVVRLLNKFMKNTKKIGLALGCGGARGIVHIGVLKVLLKNGIIPSVIAGSSMGSVIAAYYALKGEIDSLEKEALSVRKRDVVSLLDFSVDRRSFLKGKKINRYIENIFGDARIEDTNIPLAITATNLGNGQAKLFKTGLIAPRAASQYFCAWNFPTCKN